MEMILGFLFVPCLFLVFVFVFLYSRFKCAAKHVNEVLIGHLSKGSFYSALPSILYSRCNPASAPFTDLGGAAAVKF